MLKKDKNNSNNEIDNIRIINNNKNINSNNSNANINKIKNTKNNINGLMTYIKMNFKDKKNKMIKLDKYLII